MQENSDDEENVDEQYLQKLPNISQVSYKAEMGRRNDTHFSSQDSFIS